MVEGRRTRAPRAERVGERGGSVVTLTQGGAVYVTLGRSCDSQRLSVRPAVSEITPKSLNRLEQVFQEMLIRTDDELWK